MFSSSFDCGGYRYQSGRTLFWQYVLTKLSGETAKDKYLTVKFLTGFALFQVPPPFRHRFTIVINNVTGLPTE